MMLSYCHQQSREQADEENVIPGWVKTTAGWWADDKIHDIHICCCNKISNWRRNHNVIEQEVEEVQEVDSRRS